MPSRQVLAATALVLAFALAGCAGSQPPSDESAQRTLAHAQDAIRNVSAYSYELSGTATASKGDRSRTVRIEGSAAVNVTQRRFRKSVRSSGDDRTVYLDGTTAYATCPFADSVNVEEAWYPDGSVSLPENRTWRSLTDLGTLQLPFDSRVYDEGNTTVAGTDARVVRIEPDVGTWQQFESQTVYPGQSRPNQGKLEEVTLRVWVATDTHRPVKVQIDQRRSVEGATLTVEQTLRYEYDSTSVSLPRTVASRDTCPEPS